MRSLLLISLGTLLALPCETVWAAPLTDPATALPDQTIAYAEIHDPGKLLAELDTLFKGSALGNVPESLARFEQRHGQEHVRFGPPKEALGGLGLLLSPELRREMERLGGAAIGVTGLARNGQPEFVAVVLPGRSTLPGMAFRSAVTMMPTVVASQVDGVLVYRQANEHSESAPAFARTSGAILIGTQQALTQTIHRIKGKSEGKSLADTEAFRQARAQAGGNPGLFGYVNVPQFGDLLSRSMGGRREQAHQALLRQVVNPAAFRYEALSLTLSNGTLSYRQFVALDAKQQSPLLAVLPNRPADRNLLHFAPKDSLFAAVLSNAEGQKRWAAGLKLIDQFAQANGETEHPPSEQLHQAEAALNLDIGKDILGRIANLGVALANPFSTAQNQPPNGPPTPPFLFFIQGHSADDAKKLIEEAAPKLLNAINHGEGGEPANETVSGRSLHRIQVGNQSLHYGLDGTTIVVGLDGRTVAAALTAGTKKEGFLANNQIRDAVARSPQSFALLVARPVPLMFSAFAGRQLMPAPRPAVESRPALPILPAPPRKETRAREVHITRVAQRSGPGEDAAPQPPWQQMLRQFDQLGPLVVSWTRTPDHLTMAVEQTGLKPGVARLTNALLEQYLSAHAPARPGRVVPAPPGASPPPPAPRR